MDKGAYSSHPNQPLLYWISQILSVLVVSLTGIGIIFIQTDRFAKLEKDAMQHHTKSEYIYEESQVQANLALLSKLPSFGYDNLIASWTFLNFFQYFGDDKARDKTGYRVTSEFFRVMVNRDPQFLEMYPYLSASVSLYAGQPAESVHFLEQGANSIAPSLQSNAYFLWQLKGTDELLFLGRNSDAQKSYRKAAEWASLSFDPKVRSTAERSRQTAKFLASNPDSRRARVSSWFNILTNAIDDSTRQFAVQQITALGGKISVAENGALQVQLPKQD